MFYKETVNGVDLYRSTLLSHIPHGFSTRIGGISALPELCSMNLGYTPFDDDETVRENRKRFAASVGISPPFAAKKHIVTMGKQIHSTKIEYINSSNADGEYECDGFYTDDIACAVAIKTADCVPILLASEDGSCVAAVHAGWRGSAGGIAALAIRSLCGLGAEAKNISVAIGPSISPENYRVGDDFGKLLRDAMINSPSEAVRGNAETLSEKFILRNTYPDGAHCDLQSLNREILTLCGVREENIDVSGICTFRNEEFYSHRRQGQKRGVMAALIAPAVTSVFTPSQ